MMQSDMIQYKHKYKCQHKYEYGHMTQSICPMYAISNRSDNGHCNKHTHTLIKRTHTNTSNNIYTLR